MPRLDLDLTEAQKFQPIPDNQYEFEITEIGDVKTSQGGGKYVNVTFTVTDAEDQTFVGRKVFRNFMLTGKGSGFFVELYEKATGEELEIGGLASVDTDDLIGRKILGQTKIKEQEGYEPRAELDKILTR